MMYCLLTFAKHLRERGGPILPERKTICLMRLVKPACAISEGNSRTRENLSKCHYFLQHFFFVCQQRFISKTFEFPILFSKSFHVIQDNTFYVTFKLTYTVAFVDNTKRLERGSRVHLHVIWTKMVAVRLVETRKSVSNPRFYLSAKIVFDLSSVSL